MALPWQRNRKLKAAVQVKNSMNFIVLFENLKAFDVLNVRKFITPQ